MNYLRNQWTLFYLLVSRVLSSNISTVTTQLDIILSIFQRLKSGGGQGVTAKSKPRTR